MNNDCNGTQQYQRRHSMDDQVRVMAYLIWLQTGRDDPVANWLQAERDIVGTSANLSTSSHLSSKQRRYGT